MRFDAFEGEAPLDCQPCQFPWKPSVTFDIYRVGRRQYQQAATNGDAGGVMKAIRLVAKQKKMTVKQLQEMSGIDLQAEIEGLDVAEALEGLDLSAGPSPDTVARYLVRSVDGPLLYTNAGEPLGWHDSDDEAEHAGAYFLQNSPEDFTAWVISEANRIELEFRALMDAAAGNSPTSSASSAEEEGAATS